MIVLKPAYFYKDALLKQYKDIVFEDKYKYWNCDSWWQYEINIENNSWNKLQFVSVDKNDNIIGYLCASIDRDIHSVTSLGVLNFYDINVTFSRDLHKFLYNLLYEYKYRKLNFSVVIGNPAEKMYDKYVKKYNGRIVGVQKDHVKLQDNQFHDLKLYEIMNPNNHQYNNKGDI